MRPKILFLTTAHRYDDDRIFHHQAKELVQHGFEVKVCSLSSEFLGELEGVSVESKSILKASVKLKSETFKQIIADFKPDGIIASEPLAIIASKDFVRRNSCSLIYDITEWYPSMRMLAGYSGVSKLFYFLKFFLAQLYAGFLSSHFIFGEKAKRFPLAQLFPLKPQIILPYYPDGRFVFPNIKSLAKDHVTLCYTGVFSKDKGIENFFNAAKALQNRRPELKVSLLLVGSARTDSEPDYFSGLLEKYRFENLEIREAAALEDFTKTFAEADICFDLRDRNFENHHCLPIKIFYYAAAGKPVIYSDLKAIRDHVDISKFGFLVDPEDSVAVAQTVSDYIDHPELYADHAENAVRLYREKYNWKSVSPLFVNFVKKSLVQR